LTKNSDLTLASRGINLVNAIRSQKPEAIIGSMLGFAQQTGLNSSVLKNTAQQLGVPLSDANASRLMQSTVPSETDALITNFFNEAKQVRNAYQAAFGQPITDSLLEQLSGDRGFIEGYNSYLNSSAGQIDYKFSPTGQVIETEAVKTAYKNSFGKDISSDLLNQIKD
jgi:hypothetical protein